MASTQTALLPNAAAVTVRATAPRPLLANFGFSVHLPGSAHIDPVPMPLPIAPSSCNLATLPLPIRDFKGEAGALALEVSRWSQLWASCNQLNAGSRRACSCGEPRAPHPVVASGARWTTNAIARWDRGHQRERRVSLKPTVPNVAWLPPEGVPDSKRKGGA